MLEPEYLEKFSEQLLALVDALGTAIIADISKRLVKTGEITETSRRQAEILQGAGLLYKDVLKRVSQVSGYMNTEVERVFEEAGVRNLKNEAVIYKAAGEKEIKLHQSETMQKILAANVRKTKEEINNLTLTTAVKTQSAYITACNKAMMKVQTGAFSYDKAIADAIKEAAVQGTEVLYPSGHVDKLDVAVRRAVLTGVNQSAAEMNLQYVKESGCDHVETTAHSGARPTHAVWQGKVFCVSGKDSRYPPFYESTGYGTGAGLCGWNCLHNFHAFFPGISTPAYSQEMLDDYSARKYEYNSKKYTEYELSQMQRSQERKIRATKRKLTGYDAGIKNTDSNTLKAELTNRFESESAELKKQEKSLKKFCRQTGRRYESARTQVHAVLDSEGNIVGFNKSVAQKAVWASKRHTSKMQMAEQLNKLSDEERLAVQRYTGFAAHRVNRALYSGKSQMIEKEREYMNLLDSALDKGVTEHKMIVHRDTIPEFLNAFPKGFEYSDKNMRMLKGKILTNVGYTSTSFRDLQYRGRNVHLEIEVPKGYRGCLYIESLATKKYKYQQEVLFKRGFRYIIKDIKKENGRYYMKAEAIL